MYNLFLSSTSRDLQPYREAVHRVIDGLPGFQLVKMEDFGARDATAKDLCARRVRECHLLVGLMGHYYGSCPPGETISFTELEYRTATEAGLSRLMFVAPDDFPIPASLRESDASFERQQALRREVMTDRVVAAFDTPEKLASAVTRALFVWHEDRRTADKVVAPGLAEAPARAPIAGSSDQPVGPNPYRGLEAFRKEDADRFFGREALSDQLWNAFLALHATPASGEAPTRLVAVLGASGSGKSSVAQAGLLAGLEQRPLPGRPAPMDVVFTPEARPLESLAVALARQATKEPSPAKTATEFEEVLRTRENYNGLRFLAERMLDVGGTGLILLVDQFEELYSLCDDEQDRATFIVNLLHAAREPRGHVSIVLTLRSDFLGSINQHPELSRLIARQNVVVPVMGEAELRRAIEEPAKRAGHEIDPGTVDLLIEQTVGREGALPLLEFVLTRIWNGFRSGISSGETVRELGGVGGAVARAAQELYRNLSPREKTIARRAFLAMVRLGEGARDTRRRAWVDDITAGGEKPDDVLKVLRVFARPEQRLITLSATPEGFSTAEVTHEALFDHWSEFRSWLDQDRDQIRFARRLEAEVSDWLANGRPEGMLWRPPLLDLLREYRRNKAAEMPAAQLQFFEASDRQERMREQKEAEEAARRQEEERLRLENQRLKAEESARRAEEARFRLERELEQQALRARLEQQTRLAGERRRFTRLAAAAAVIAGVLATAAGMGFWQAQEAVFETKAGAFWYRLQLWSDPLKPEDVATLWDLAGADDQVRVAFVRQMANDRQLLRRFGFKPQPIARAVGLRWPDEARQIVKQSVAYVASDQFDPGTADRFELIAYTRALAALRPWLDPALADAATKKLADAINALAGGPQLSDRRLWALAETVAVFSGRLDPAAIERARERLRREIMATDATDDSGRRARAISRAVEIMAPVLTLEERFQAVRYLVPRLGQDIDSWAAAAIPRALLALVPTLDASQADAMLSAVPQAIARVAVASGERDSSYPLALVRLAEALAGHETLGAAFSQALTRQFALPNDPLQHAALARAAVPLLARPGGSTPALVSAVAAITLVPGDAGAYLEPASRSHFRKAAFQKAEAALRASDGQQATTDAEGVLSALREVWNAGPYYLSPPRVRLLELVAPSLPPESAALASTDLLQMLPGAADSLTREAIARALAALAQNLPDAERQAALADAKAALARTGSTEEATAWADAIAALLPAEPRAATAEIVEALKYPTATGAPTNILLAALAKPWPEEHKTIAGRTLPDPTVMDWLEARLPDGHSLSEPPPPPPNLRSADAGPEPG